MTTVGAFDAQTHLNALMKRVPEGETIRITRRGVPIAIVVPANDADKGDPGELVRDIRELRQGVTLGKISIQKLIREGHRY